MTTVRLLAPSRESTAVVFNMTSYPIADGYATGNAPVTSCVTAFKSA